MANFIDIRWGYGANLRWVATLGQGSAVIQPCPRGMPGYEARIWTPATGYGEPHIARTRGEAVRWVEQILVRLPNAAV